MSSPSCELSLQLVPLRQDSSSLTYHPGDLIRGYVVIFVSKPTTICSVWVNVLGFATDHVRSKQYTTTGAFHTEEVYPEKFLDSALTVRGRAYERRLDDNLPCWQFNPGTYRLPFSIALPISSPPSQTLGYLGKTNEKSIYQTIDYQLKVFIGTISKRSHFRHDAICRITVHPGDPFRRDLRLPEELTGSIIQRMPPNQELHCALCAKEFGWLVLRHHCRMCGLAFCGFCSKKRVHPLFGLEKVSFCHPCHAQSTKTVP